MGRAAPPAREEPRPLPVLDRGRPPRPARGAVVGPGCGQRLGAAPGGCPLRRDRCRGAAILCRAPGGCSHPLRPRGWASRCSHRRGFGAAVPKPSPARGHPSCFWPHSEERPSGELAAGPQQYAAFTCRRAPWAGGAPQGQPEPLGEP